MLKNIPWRQLGLLAIIFVVAYTIDSRIKNKESLADQSFLEPIYYYPLNPSVFSATDLPIHYSSILDGSSFTFDNSKDKFFLYGQGVLSGKIFGSLIKGYRIKDVAKTLGENSDLVYFIDTHDLGTDSKPYIVHISKQGASVVQSGLSRSDIILKTKSLRCGLDIREWQLNYEFCSALYPNIPRDIPSEKLPFDLNLSHALFNGIFENISKISEGTLLHFVLSGAISSFPMNVLVVGPGETFDSSKWFVQSYSHTVHTSVESFIASRARKDVSGALRKKQSFLGVGNPNILGDLDSPFYSNQFKKTIKMARAFTSCTTGQLLGFGDINKFKPIHQRYAGVEVDKNGIVKSQSIHRMTPLPESAFEVCNVSQNFKTTKKKMLLSKYAREQTLKYMSSEGTLRDYRIIHFASHAVLDSGNDLSKTGVVLSPQRRSSEFDDGFLSADEISVLDLDADWVILSACNTGNVSSDSGEHLSGLADAFFSANARTILVSNWAVISKAAMEIVTQTMHNYVNELDSKNEALRNSILAVMGSKGIESHPAYWGPFSIVER